MKDVLNFAIVGCGVISRFHAEAICEQPDARLVAVCDSYEKNRLEAAQNFGADAYADYNEMLKREDIDVVNILTSSGTHAEIGIRAARAGKHVITEKPMDITMENADALITACRRAGVKLSCIFQHRFDRAAADIKRAVEEGKFGRLNFGASHTKWYRSQEYYDNAGWRGTWALDGGGALMNQSIHYVDLLQYIMGPVDEVFAYCTTRTHERIEVEDIAVASVKFKSGALGIIEGNVSAYPGFCTRLDIYGDNGSAIIENNGMKEWKFKSGEEYDFNRESPAKSAHFLQIRDIIDSIQEDREPLVNGEEARKSLGIVLAVYESARTGKPVKVTEQ